MNVPARRGPSPIRLGVVALLLLASFLTALPWLGCGLNPVTHIIDGSLLGHLHVRRGPVPARHWGFTGPYWGNLIVGVGYLIATIFAAVTKRPL